jgi:hypothetical protein
MIDRKYLREVERLNRLPLSQEALKRLKEAKAEISPNTLYLIQLAHWGTEKGLELHGVKRPMLESILLNISDRQPQKAYNQLVLNEDRVPQIGVESLQGSPKDAALILLEQLGWRILSNPHYIP